MKTLKDECQIVRHIYNCVAIYIP